MTTGLAHALWKGSINVRLSILLIRSAMICPLNEPARYDCARMGTASAGVTMARSVAWTGPRRPSHIGECVRSISRILLCNCSRVSPRSTSSTGSSDVDGSSPVGISWVAFYSGVATKIGPLNGSEIPSMLFFPAMAWSGLTFQTLTKNGSQGLTSASQRVPATDFRLHRRMLGEMVPRTGVAQVSISHSSIRPLTRSWRHARF